MWIRASKMAIAVLTAGGLVCIPGCSMVWRSPTIMYCADAAFHLPQWCNLSEHVCAAQS